MDVKLSPTSGPFSIKRRPHPHHTHNSGPTTTTTTHALIYTPTAKKCRFSAASLIHPVSPSPSDFHCTDSADSILSPAVDLSPISPVSSPDWEIPVKIVHEDVDSLNSEDFTTLHITHLVPELLTKVFSYLEKKDRARVAVTCSYFNQILKNRQIWKGTEARLNLRPNQGHTYHSLIERGVVRVQVLSLKRSLRELTSHIKVTHLRLSGCYNVTDYSLNSMHILPSLVELDLSLCKQISDAGLVHILAKTPSLTRLDLGGCCNLTDRAALLIAYGLRSLKSLDLRSCYNLTDKALSYLAGDVYLSDRHEIKTYNFLARVGLIDCELCRRPGPEKGSKHRIELPKINEHTEFGMLSLESLVLQDCQKISDLGLQCISKIGTLSSLNLSFCVNITDSGLRFLSPLSGVLTELNLRSCDNISDVGFQTLRECGSLRHLDLSFCEKISTLNPTVCKMLRTLSLSACDIGDGALLGLPVNMEQLETLNLGQCDKISDMGIGAISEKCPNLRYIDLYGCSAISTKGLKDIMAMPLLKNVNLGLWKI